MAKSKKKILSPAQAKRAIARLQREGGRVVFTNGCFDLLHAGHVYYLEKARALGDALIVALNSDSSVKRLKGPKRPLNPLADRASVMAALECVDFVTSFSEATPRTLIEHLSPNVLVKAGDYKISEVEGREHVWSTGGTVKILPFLKGRSTTALIKRGAR